MLLNSVKLPYHVVKGSIYTRHNKADNFTYKIIKELSPSLDCNGITLSQLGKMLKKILPDNISLFVCKNKTSDASAQIKNIYTKDNYIVKHAFEVNTNEDNRINYLHIPLIAHEIQHLADYLFNPKFLLREQILAKKGLDSPKYAKFYDNEIYQKEMFNGKKDKKRIIKIIKHKIHKILRGLKFQDKIDLLQFMRYNLISEDNAYRQTRKYSKKLYKKYLPVYDDELQNQNKQYMFEEKIKLLKDMTFQLTKRERGIHRSKIKQKR